MAAKRGGEAGRGLPVKALLAIGIVTLAVGGAAAVLVADDGTDDSSDDAVEQVPADVTGVTHVDPGVLGDPVVADLYEGATDRVVERTMAGRETPGNRSQGLPTSGESLFPTTLQSLGEHVANETGLDPTAADEIVTFQRQSTGSLTDVGETEASELGTAGQSYRGAIVHADWDEHVLVGHLENRSSREYENATIDGATVYRPTEDGKERDEGVPFEPSAQWLAVLDDGEYVVGSPAAVNDSVAVARGSASAVGGDLLSAYEQTNDGFVRSATLSPNVDATLVNRTMGDGAGFNLTKYVEAYNDLHVTASSTYTTADGIGSETVVLTNATDTARDVASLYEGFLAIQAGAVQNETIENQLRSVDVEREETTVTVSREVTAETALEILDWYLSLIPNGDTAMPPGGPSIGGGSGSGAETGTDFGVGLFALA